MAPPGRVAHDRGKFLAVPVGVLLRAESSPRLRAPFGCLLRRDSAVTTAVQRLLLIGAHDEGRDGHHFGEEHAPTIASALLRHNTNVLDLNLSSEGLSRG